MWVIEEHTYAASALKSTGSTTIATHSSFWSSAGCYERVEYRRANWLARRRRSELKLGVSPRTESRHRNGLQLVNLPDDTLCPRRLKSCEGAGLDRPLLGGDFGLAYSR